MPRPEAPRPEAPPPEEPRPEEEEEEEEPKKAPTTRQAMNVEQLARPGEDRRGRSRQE